MLNTFVTPVATSIPFNNSTNGFISKNLQQAVEEVNANISIFSQNFSFYYIAQGFTVTIPIYQEMITTELMIDGELVIDGRLTMLDL
jgi:hypothetical protein